MRPSTASPHAMRADCAVSSSAAAEPSTAGAACELSVVVPVYNEADVLPELSARLLTVLHALGMSFELIFVDDGSTDSTCVVLSQLHQLHAHVGVLRLSRNFGKEVALSAGLATSSGACVVSIDADLQDPPELIPEMVRAWQTGHDVVNMRRRRRDGETWLKTFSAHLFYRLLNRLSDTRIPVDVGDFRLLSRRVVNALNALPERNRYMKGLFAWVGYPQITLEYDRAPRAAGTSKLGYWRLCALAVQGVTSFSVAPLRLAFLLGVLVACVAFGMTVFYVVKTLLYGESVHGFPTLIVTILTLGGLNLLGLGVLGEYVGRMLMEAKGRPLYLVDMLDAPRTAAAAEADAATASAGRNGALLRMTRGDACHL
jgi:glycosyltransferase involved in cell wall biosynthesis